MKHENKIIGVCLTRKYYLSISTSTLRLLQFVTWHFFVILCEIYEQSENCFCTSFFPAQFLFCFVFCCESKKNIVWTFNTDTIDIIALILFTAAHDASIFLISVRQAADMLSFGSFL